MSALNNHMIDISSQYSLSSFYEAYHEAKSRIINRGDVGQVTTQELIRLLDKLTHFELGRFLITHKVLNGYWIDYILKYPEWKKDGKFTKELSFEEDFFLNYCPVTSATQERFQIFKTLIRENIFDGIKALSVPSGMMSDLLDLEYPINAFTLIGVDSDQDNIEMASDKARNRGLEDHVKFICCDPWNYQISSSVDMVISNGLTIYEHSDTKVEDFFKHVYDSLNFDGCFITSFLTPPPTVLEDSEWSMQNINLEYLRLQNIFLYDILNVTFTAYRSSNMMKKFLKKVGFKSIEFVYDKGRIFPSVIARKE